MKKIIFLLLILCLVSGCSKKIEFEVLDKDINSFHEVNVAEKINDGILYYNGNKILYDESGNITEIADNVSYLWRENQDIYYNSDSILYSYNFETKETKQLVKNPYTILGKYNGNIISYQGRNIYSINGKKKTKIFSDGYYLNSAVLYDNKVYGIPASNVYEYNLDTLEVNKVTKKKHDIARIIKIENELYIMTFKSKNNNQDRKDFSYFLITDKGLEEKFTIKNVSYASLSKVVKNGVFVSINKNDNDKDNSNNKGNKLVYIENGKTKIIDKNYNYEVIGLFNNKLLYYKNNYYYGSEQKNLENFYLYDGKNNVEAFNLDIGYYESLSGYEYENGILIELTFESSTILYNYDGKNIKLLDTPYIYRIIALSVLDDKIYIRYSNGEESTEILGTIINLK